MFDSSVLDVAIGVIFGFLAVSLITSAIVEAINSLLKLRSATLLSGVKDLVNDPQFNGLAKQLYQHAAINPRGSVTNPLKNRPAYIEARQFANAMLDLTGISSAATAPNTSLTDRLKAINAAVSAITDPQIKELLGGIVARTACDVVALQKEVGEWFDTAMDRVSGSFKRQTQLFSFVIALAAAFLLNVDTIHLATGLWEHPEIADQLKIPTAIGSVSAASSSTDVAAAQGALQIAATDVTSVLDSSLPVGWPPGHFLQFYVPSPKTPGSGSWVNVSRAPGFFMALSGWLATAIATLFGAPFWFDALQSFVRLKGSGPSPQEKEDGTAASA